MSARLQISCSTPELNRLSGLRKTPKDYRATPVATPEVPDGGASTKPDGERKRTRRQGSRELHDRLISDYVARRPQTKLRGFARALRDIVARSEDLRDQVRLEGWELEPVGLIPDAFFVSRIRKEITIVEAEVTSRISAAKWEFIVRLWWLLDAGEWKTWVHTIDRTGAVFSVNTPLVAARERWANGSSDFYFELARNPPGAQVLAPGETRRIRDDWPDEVAAIVQRHGGFSLEPDGGCKGAR